MPGSRHEPQGKEVRQELGAQEQGRMQQGFLQPGSCTTGGPLAEVTYKQQAEV